MAMSRVMGYHEKENEMHCILLGVDKLFESAPSHLLFDLQFLEFLRGMIMLPNRSNPYSEQDFDFIMPPFNSIIKILRHGLEWEILYACDCKNPMSLQCMSRCIVLFDYWKLELNKYIENEIKKEKNPILIYSFDDYPARRPFISDNPIEHLYVILRLYEKNYAVGRNGNHYYVFIKSKYCCGEIRESMYQLMKTIRRLPFYLTIDCVPFFKIEYDMATEYDMNV
nr:ORF14 protein [Duck aviadenovirus]